MKRYLVTGATEWLGRRLAEALLARGDDVSALIGAPGYAVSLRSRGIRVLVGDVRDAATLARAMQDCDGVFHTEGWDPGAPELGARAWKAALSTSASAPRVVFARMHDVSSDTTREVTVEAGSPERASPPWITAVPFGVYGPDDAGPMGAALLAFVRRRLPAVPRDAECAWTYIDDVVGGLIAAMERGRVGATYLLAGPHHGWAEALDLAEAVTGIPAPRWRPPRTAFLAAARAARKLETWLALPPHLGATMWSTLGSAAPRVRSDAARDDLGFIPRALDEGLPLTLADTLRRSTAATRA